MIRFALFAVLVAALSLISIDASAFPGLDATVASRYPAATELATCGTCHTSFTGSPSTLNPYGEDVDTARGGGFDFDAAMAAVEGDDSDGDGTSNMDEIDTDAGVHPGWTCETYTSATNPPSNLADIVDPIDPGCDGATTTTLAPTTTTIPTTTSTLGSTTTSTTSTTLPGAPQCSQPISSGPTPVSTDCLYILQAAVGSQTCTPECICAPTGTLPAKATDALLCLNVAVGVELPLDCPCAGGTTTTTLGGGSTTTTLGGGSTTTTLGATTTTTLGPTTTTTTSTTLEPPTTTTTSTTLEPTTTTTIVM